MSTSPVEGYVKRIYMLVPPGYVSSVADMMPRTALRDPRQ
jgi:hypothetical protein